MNNWTQDQLGTNSYFLLAKQKIWFKHERIRGISFKSKYLSKVNVSKILTNFDINQVDQVSFWMTKKFKEPDASFLLKILSPCISEDRGCCKDFHLIFFCGVADFHWHPSEWCQRIHCLWRSEPLQWPEKHAWCSKVCQMKLICRAIDIRISIEVNNSKGQYPPGSSSQWRPPSWAFPGNPYPRDGLHTGQPAGHNN